MGLNGGDSGFQAGRVAPTVCMENDLARATYGITLTEYNLRWPRAESCFRFTPQKSIGMSLRSSTMLSYQHIEDPKAFIESN